MSTYCAPCVADLALLRDAVTSVNGTAACVAHAVLLTHPGDNPQRRLQRLSELRAMAEGKLATASADDVPSIELLVQEYALAGAMDMTVPLKELAGDRAPRPPKKRRDRDRGRDRGPRQDFPVETRPASSDSPAPDASSGDRPHVSEPGGAPATPASDTSGNSGDRPDVSEAGAAQATPGSDNSGGGQAPGSGAGGDAAGAPVPDPSQQPAAREPQPSPPPAPHGDSLLAPEGVNSASTTAQDTPDVKPERPEDAPVGE